MYASRRSSRASSSGNASRSARHRLGDGLERASPRAGTRRRPPTSARGRRGRRPRPAPPSGSARSPRARLARRAVGHLVRRRQVDEAHRHVVLERVADRPPLRREARERVERGARGLVGDVGEQRDRRLHVLARGERSSASASGGPSIRTASGLQLVRARARGCGPSRVRGGGSRRRCGLTASRQARYSSPQPSRSRTTVSRYSCQTTRSWTGSWTTAPVSPPATSSGAERAVAEVGGEREAVGDDARSPRRSTACRTAT